jgi:hypothetical protein
MRKTSKRYLFCNMESSCLRRPGRPSILRAGLKFPSSPNGTAGRGEVTTQESIVVTPIREDPEEYAVMAMEHR